MHVLALIGDVMLGRGVNEEIAARPPETFWGATLPVLRGADAVLANLECAITSRRTAWWKTPKVFHFRADPAAINVLLSARVRCVSLANNHTLDFCEEGLAETMDLLAAAGIAYAGAGRNLEEAMRPALFDVGDLRIGMISLTDNEPPFAASLTHPGTFYWPIRRWPTDLAPVEQSLKDARDAGARLVILAMHWGPNMLTHACDEFCTFAHAAIDRGIDLVFGHSAHIFQGVEQYRDRLILYDTGDFIDDYVVDPRLRNDWSFVFLIEADHAGRLHRLRLVPVRLRYAGVDLADGWEAGDIIARMTSLCAEYGAVPLRTPEGLELPLASSTLAIDGGHHGNKESCSIEPKAEDQERKACRGLFARPARRT